MMNDKGVLEMDADSRGSDQPRASETSPTDAAVAATTTGPRRHLWRRLLTGEPRSAEQRKLDLAYAVFALVVVAWAGAVFAGAMHYQLFLAASRLHDALGTRAWSAPLDDVFIHFD